MVLTCDFQQCGILKSINSDKPVPPPFKLKNSKWCSVSSLTVIEIFKPMAKALISLRVCAGWSEPLLVAHTTLLEILCHGSYIKLYHPLASRKNIGFFSIYSLLSSSQFSNQCKADFHLLTLNIPPLFFCPENVV